MYPALLAYQLRDTVLDYLRTTFSLRDQALEEALFEFLQHPQEGLFRGPYLDLRLPFQSAASDESIPLEIAPPFAPYAHQLQAWRRLSSQGQSPKSTLVTTGTGSGKTECFLYPILDHCWRHRNEPGIKAIILYPMNALASDQAERIAKEIHNWRPPGAPTDAPPLRGQVRAGLYVGGKGQHASASELNLIDDRSVLRQAPPHILLTNYRMLDLLLMRPNDRELWGDNGPETLKYIVLDELHTYDGAQGSDVACLLRRLRERLGMKQSSVCWVGTSATIGEGAAGREQLLNFASSVFGHPMEDASIIQESRQSIDQAFPEPPEAEALYPGRLGVEELQATLPVHHYEGPQEYLEAQAKLWLGEAPESADESEKLRTWIQDNPASALEVGRALSKHPFLHELLAAHQSLQADPQSIEAVLERLDPNELGPDKDLRRDALVSFLSLISYAKREVLGRVRPFLSLQVQFWVRELRGLLRKVSGESMELVWRDDVPDDKAQHYLPLVICRDCGHHGLAAMQRDRERHLRGSAELGKVGENFFRSGSSSRFLEILENADEVLPASLCPCCLDFSTKQETCSCQGPPTDMLPARVHKPEKIGTKSRWECPECDAKDRLGILGSRAASLSSVLISHLFSSPYNQDRKLLAFSDSVQDASHRAGFFSSRTYRFNLRTALQRVLEDSDTGEVPLGELMDRVLAFWTPKLEPDSEHKGKTIATFTPADLHLHAAYEDFIAHFKSGPKSEGSKKKDYTLAHKEADTLMRDRLSWELNYEMTLGVRIGRSLERSGCASASFDENAIARAAQRFSQDLTEKLFRNRAAPDSAAVQHFMRSILHRLRLQGGVFHPLLDAYVAEGKRYWLTRLREPRLPFFPPHQSYPRFLHLKSGHDCFDNLRAKRESSNWYQDFFTRVFGSDLPKSEIGLALDHAIRRLVQQELLEERESKSGAVVGLLASSIAVTRKVKLVVCNACNSSKSVAEENAEHWEDQACTAYRCAGYYELAEQDTDPGYYANLYRRGTIGRVYAQEHTGLLQRDAREALERDFKSQVRPDAPNLLTCTPTLEMGIDVGDLSAVFLCSVPPLPANYLQRIGRAGRSTGNALVITVATSRPHDQHFFAAPEAMMRGQVRPPGCFLNAPEILSRQMLAHTLDQWARDEEDAEIPRQMRSLARSEQELAFPQDFFSYYKAHKDPLHKRFLAMFEDVLKGNAKARLIETAQGEVLLDGMQKAFTGVHEERKVIQSRKKNLQARLKKLESGELDPIELPDDPGAALDSEKKEIRYALSRYELELKNLAHKHPLNVLTDAGVLPNFAFPEPGVTLNSTIQSGRGRAQKGAKRQRAPIASKVNEYIRPSSAALREFAPFNHFYAGGQRVQISQIDVGNKNREVIERWRICSQCQHAEPETEKQELPSTCPSCGARGWDDSGRLRELLEFRRAWSNTTLAEASTSDDSEDRKRESYTILELIDVTDENRTGEARLVNEDKLLFGCELLRNLTIRELNFGQRSRSDATIEVAGHSISQSGFEVCQDCGAVQKQGERESHLPYCKTRKKPGSAVFSNVVLYRSIKSEAIRVLLPLAHHDLDRMLPTLRAAFELGFRAYFQGQPTHLRVTTTHEPVGESCRRYLVIYDTVPGGTGYLAELWQDDKIFDILGAARKELAECVCAEDEEKDGCYRCIYAYQHQRDLSSISRRQALEFLDRVLEPSVRKAMKPCQTLSEVNVDKLTDSELEDRLIGILGKAGELKAKHDFSGWSMDETQWNGRFAWRLSTGSDEAPVWTIVPQVDLGPGDQVELQCRPDFVFYPDDAVNHKAIAVFADGLRYHVHPGEKRSRIPDDIRKRQAILDSDRFWVWSLTWDDVQEVEEAIFESDKNRLDRFEGAHRALTQPGASTTQTKVQNDVFGPDTPCEVDLAGRNNVELLLRFLASPNAEAWNKGVLTTLISCMKAAPHLKVEDGKQYIRELKDPDLRPQEPSATRKKPGSSVYGMLSMSHISIALSLPVLQSKNKAEVIRPLQGTMRLFDDPKDRVKSEFKNSWRAFWQNWNLMQFLDQRFDAVSTQQLQEDAGATLNADPLAKSQVAANRKRSMTPPIPTREPVEAQSDPEWAELVSSFGEDISPLYRVCSAKGLPAPTEAVELLSGTEEQEAALAWEQAKVCLCYDLHPLDQDQWTKAGWRAFDFDEHDPNEVAQAISERLAS